MNPHENRRRPTSHEFVTVVEFRIGPVTSSNHTFQTVSDTARVCPSGPLDPRTSTPHSRHGRPLARDKQKKDEGKERADRRGGPERLEKPSVRRHQPYPPYGERRPRKAQWFIQSEARTAIYDSGTTVWCPSMAFHDKMPVSPAYPLLGI